MLSTKKVLCSCIRLGSKKHNNDVKQLDYRHGSLDHVPNDVFVKERTLEELLLDANSICELPRELFCCTGLRILSISDNELKILPPAIGSLICLEKLDASKNSLAYIPDAIKNCKRLSKLDLSVNPLGRLPEGICQCLSLNELFLNDCLLDFVPGQLGRLTNLQVLELRENRLRTLPKSFDRFISLERLDIGTNDFDEFPDVIGDMKNLKEVWCDRNKIEKLPHCIGNLKKLVFLDASKNRLNLISEKIESCDQLADLHLSSNDLQGLPETLGRLSNLTTLKVDDNLLESLPYSLGGLASLSELEASANQLTFLPTSIGLLRNLRTLYLNENILKQIPSELGSCQALTVLSLRYNQLQFLPDEIGRIPKLRVLNLSSNNLINLPMSMMRLTYLQALWLSENQAQPLIRLQSDIQYGRKVLTCYLLPQQPELDDISINDDYVNHERQQKITWDSEAGESVSRLERVPTPGPAEMRARNVKVQRRLLDPEIEDAPVLGRRAERQAAERHVLYRADREKMFKDKEKMKHHGQEIDDGGFKKSPIIIKDVPLLLGPPPSDRQIRRSSLSKGYESDSGLARKNVSGYESDTGYRSDAEIYQRMKAILQHKPVKSQSTYELSSGMSNRNSLPNNSSLIHSTPTRITEVIQNRHFQPLSFNEMNESSFHSTSPQLQRIDEMEHFPQTIGNNSRSFNATPIKKPIVKHAQYQDDNNGEDQYKKQLYKAQIALNKTSPNSVNTQCWRMDFKISPNNTGFYNGYFKQPAPTFDNKIHLSHPSSDIPFVDDSSKEDLRQPFSQTSTDSGYQDDHPSAQLSIKLYKNPDLGISIAGGLHSPGNPFNRLDTMGIYITRVLEPNINNLQVRDKIIKINGVKCNGMDHNAIVNWLRDSQSPVELLVERRLNTKHI